MALPRKIHISLSPEKYGKLKLTARTMKKPVEELVKEAIERVYFSESIESRMASVERLAKMDLPVSEWGIMEEEIIKGRIE